MNAFLKGFISMFDWMCPRTVDEQLQNLYDDMDWGKYKNPVEEYSKLNNWIVIDDEKVCHRWECPECDKPRFIYPWFYSEMGEPVCEECDCDMEYIHTEVNLG